MKSLWKRILCVAIAICMMLQPVAYVQAEGEVQKISGNTTYEIEAYVNPIYKDCITEDALVSVKKRARSVSDVEATSDEAEIVAQIRKAMVDRESEFTVCYATESDYDATWLATWWEQVFDETDDSHEGDYLRCTYGGRGTGTVTVESSGDMNYYTFNAPVTYYTTKEQEEKLDTKLEEVLTELEVLDSSKSDYEKTVAIYDYICSNITYDYTNLKDDSYMLKYTAYAALMNGTSVCQGYAALMYRMLEEADIDTRMVTGTGNGGGHAWNISELNGKYYYSDSTWDATYKQAGFEYAYFLKGTDDFDEADQEIEPHEPDANSFVYQKPYATKLSETAYVPGEDGGETDDEEEKSNIRINRIWMDNPGIEVQADDELAIYMDAEFTYGPSSFTIWFQAEDNEESSIMTTVSYDETAEDNIYMLNLQMEEDMYPGTWRATQYSVQDYYGEICTGPIEDSSQLYFEVSGEEIVENEIRVNRIWMEDEPGKTYEIGDELTVYMEAEFSNVPSVLSLWIESVDNPACSELDTLVYDEKDEDGIYTFTFKVDEHMYPGKWIVSSYSLQDNYGNIETDSIENTDSLYFNVAGEVTGNNRIEVKDIWMDNPGVDLEPEMEVTFYMEAEFDNRPYLFSMWFESVENPSSVELVTVSYDNATEDNIYEFTLNIDERMFPGKWIATNYAIQDIYGTHLGGTVSDADKVNFNVYIDHKADENYTVIEEATCQKEGKEVQKCTICGEVIIGTERVIPKAEHSWDEGKVEKAPTGNDSGKMLYKCTMNGCNGEKTEEVPVVERGESEDGNVTWKLYNEGTLVIDGTGIIPENQFAGRKDIKNLVINEGITGVGKGTFQDCTNIEGDLIIPEGIQTIGDFAFAMCGGFKGKLVIPETVTSIGQAAFMWCEGLRGELKIPSGLTEIEANVFAYCYGLTGELEIPESVTSIGAGAFACCVGLTGELVISKNITRLESNVFCGCSGFTGELVIPEGVTFIGESAFSGCEGFTGNLIIPDSVEKIEQNAFSWCTGLDGELKLSNKLTTIEKYAFQCNYNLTGELEIPESVTSIEDAAFLSCAIEKVVLRNKNCVITDSQNVIAEETIIVGYQNSTAHDYADKYGRQFECLDHSMGNNVEIVKNPSCSETGELRGKCSVCDAVIIEEIEKLTHEKEETYTVERESTCIVQGQAYYKCKNCGIKLEGTGFLLELKEHKWNAGNIPAGKEPTCTKTGERHFACTEVGCEETKVEIEPIDAENHVWDNGEITKPATCEELGEKTYHCVENGCNGIKTEDIESMGHSYGSWFTDETATCTKEGSRYKVCGTCEHKEIETIAKLAHKWNGGVVTVKATCEKTGTKVYTCSSCKGTKSETIKAAGHKFKVTKTKKATTKKNGQLTKKCKVCAKTTKETLYRAKSISLSKTKFVYNGKSQKPTVVVKDSKGKVISSSNYKVSYSKGRKNVGTYKVTVKFKGQYSGKLTKSFKITKAKQVITASNFTKVKGDKAFSIKAKRSSGGGKLTYKTSNKKIATVSKKGKVTIKKAGKVTITITAAANKNYKKATKKITIIVNPK